MKNHMVSFRVSEHDHKRLKKVVGNVSKYLQSCVRRKINEANNTNN